MYRSLCENPFKERKIIILAPATPMISTLATASEAQIEKAGESYWAVLAKSLSDTESMSPLLKQEITAAEPASAAGDDHLHFRCGGALHKCHSIIAQGSIKF